MKIAFFGSPQIAADLLTELLKENTLHISLIITQPDKPAGKKLELTSTPVKKVAIQHKIDIFDGDIRDKAILQDLESTLVKGQFDLGILYAYGALIPEKIIELIPQGIWNVHPSLLPLYRGPSPTAYPLLLGDPSTGVTIMKLVKKLDAGPIIAQKVIDIDKDIDRDQLEKQLTSEAVHILVEKCSLVSAGAFVTTHEQDSTKSTYTRLLNKEDGYISADLIRLALSDDKVKSFDYPKIIQEYMTKYDIQKEFLPSEIIYNMFRALSPWPGIWTNLQTKQGLKRLKINNLSFLNTKLQILTVQLEGKKEVDFKTFNKAYNFISEF